MQGSALVPSRPLESCSQVQEEVAKLEMSVARRPVETATPELDKALENQPITHEHVTSIQSTTSRSAVASAKGIPSLPVSSSSSGHKTGLIGTTMHNWTTSQAPIVVTGVQDFLRWQALQRLQVALLSGLDGWTRLRRRLPRVGLLLRCGWIGWMRRHLQDCQGQGLAMGWPLVN